MLDLKSSGADVFFDASTPKFSAMSIRKTTDIDWHPLHIIDFNGALVKPALEFGGLRQVGWRGDSAVFEGSDRSRLG